MAHAVLGAVVAELNNQSAAAGGLGAGGGELAAHVILDTLFPGKKVSDLSESEKQQVSALSQLAAGLAGGLTTGDVAGAVTAAQAGKNAVENNWAAAATGTARLTVLGCSKIPSCRAAVIEIGLGTLFGAGTTAITMNDLSDSDRDMVMVAALSKDPRLFAQLTPEQKAAYESWTGKAVPNTGGDQLAGTNSSGKLENPAPEQSKGTSLVTPNPSDEKEITNTGNTDGKPDIGGNTTVTPIPDGPSQDDLAYLAGGYEPNKGAVGNMGEFLGQPGFGKNIGGNSQKTGEIVQGQSVYQAKGAVGDYIAKGDKFYLDGSHRNHIEVFDSRGKAKVVLNLDGSYNKSKTEAALKEGRRLK